MAVAGINAVGHLSVRTISWIIKEGYIVQLGYEIQAAEAITLSADGTGHKKINYNSHHANYKISDSHGKKTQVTHFLGIERSLDGSIGMYSDHCAKEKKKCQPYESKENGCNWTITWWK